MSVPADQDAFGGQVGDNAAFASFMDIFVPEENDSQVGEGAQEAPTSSADDRQPAQPAEATGDQGAVAPAGTDGDGREPAVQDGTAGTGVSNYTAAAGERTLGVGSVDHASIADDFGKIALALESNTLQGHREAVLAEAREEFANYFDALTKHPRLLVGQEVPSLTSDGMEVIRDSADAKEWQEAVKALLSEEVHSRAQKKMEESSESLQTLHASVEIFQNNRDLVPGTKTFNRELADAVMKIARPYMLKVDGKLQGFSIPMQPLIDQMRTELAARPATAQASAPAQPAPKGSAGAPAKEHQARAEGPQAGIKSKAGAVSDGENFDALFGTLGIQANGIRF